MFARVFAPSVLARMLAGALLSTPLVVPGAAVAQLDGTIRDPDGQPIASVAVELWSARARLAGTLTDSVGRFDFPAGVTPAAVSIVARRIGYLGMSAPVREGERVVQYVMRPAAPTLPTVVTRAAERRCPRRDDPVARTLWDRARTRYAMLPEGYGMTYDAMADSQDVTAPDAAIPANAIIEQDAWGIGAALRWADTTRIRTLGYAWPYYIGTRRHGPDRRWRYPALGSYLAEHFASEQFGARHVFTVAGTNDGAVSIAFCARSDEQPEIAGTIRLSADTSFIDASWRFITPGPREDAGGVVTFIPYRAGASPPLLLAARSITWHRRDVRDGFYVQRRIAFRHWWTAKTMLVVSPAHARADTVP